MIAVVYGAGQRATTVEEHGPHRLTRMAKVLVFDWRGEQTKTLMSRRFSSPALSPGYMPLA